MRLPEGIVVNAKETFGRLKFSALRREVFAQDSEGNSTGELKYRTYDLKSEAQGMMIQVSVPADVEVKTFDYNAPVELVEPYIDTVSTATYRGRADAGWYIRSKDIITASKTETQEGEKSGSGAGVTEMNGKTHTGSSGNSAQTKKG